jgi:hypothetical protein
MCLTGFLVLPRPQALPINVASSAVTPHASREETRHQFVTKTAPDFVFFQGYDVRKSKASKGF